MGKIPQQPESEQVLQKPKESFFKKNYALLALLAIDLIIVIIYVIHISSYTQLPSPLFGGDNYRDRGFVKNIVAGNPVWSDAFYANEIQYYGYLIPALQAGFIKLTGADIDKTFLFFPILTLVISSFVWYLLGLKIFKHKKWGLLTSVSFLFLVHYISPAFATVAYFIFFPAFLYFWLKYEQENKKMDAIFSGLFLGLLSLTYGGAFLGALGMIVIAIAINFLAETIHNKTLLKNAFRYLKKYYLLFLVAGAIAMIYFLPLILKYNFHSVNNVQQWGDTKIELLGPVWVLKLLKNLFFNTTNILTIITSLIALAGLAAIALAKKTKETAFVLMLLLANIITIQQHLILRPLGFTFFSEKLVFLPYFLPLFFVFGAIVLSQQIKKELLKKIFLAGILILLVITFTLHYNAFKNDAWVKTGQSDNTLIKAFYSLADFIETNVGKNETILSNDESGFMLAVLSGRKVMLTRRTHASYFVDIDKRIADATVAAYGDNISLSTKILKRYNVKYFYVDQNLLNYPMRVRTDLKEYLTKNNVNFTEAHDRYDIAVPLDRATLLDLLIIPPQKINPAFLELWEKVYSVKIEGNVIAELYKLKEEK